MKLQLGERLKQPGVLLGDGAMGTMLMERGLKPGECPERYNLQHSEVLEEIAASYLSAGAEIIETNTFGGSPLKLEAYGLDPQTELINSLAVRAVRSAVGTNAYISASCGPSGKILEPYGDTSREEVYESYLRQIRALISEGVDLICCETMTDLTEATLAVKAARKVSSDIPVFATMTFDLTPKGFYTMMGVGIEQAAKGLAEAGADAVGSNCGNGIVHMVQIASEFIKYSSLPVISQSNAGLPVNKDGVTIYQESPEFMADKSRDMITMGVKVIGGCCGTTPAHILALKKVVGEFNQFR